MRERKGLNSSVCQVDNVEIVWVTHLKSRSSVGKP